MAIGGVAACVGEVIAAHTVMLLAMADDRLNGGTPFELALDRRREAALLAARVALELVIGRGVVAAIAGIGDAAIEDVADERLHLRDDRAQRVPVIGIAGQFAAAWVTNCPPGGMLHRGGDAHFDTEFVRPVRFALADALNLEALHSAVRALSVSAYNRGCMWHVSALYRPCIGHRTGYSLHENARI